MAHDQKKLAYWIEQFRKWQASGLSQRSYCERAGVSFPSFNHWRRRAREIANSKPAMKSGVSARTVTLVPVSVASNGAGMDHKAIRDVIELRSPGGWYVTMPTAS